MKAVTDSVGTSESDERWCQADADMERMKRTVTALQSDGKALGKSVANLEDGFDAFKTRLGATAYDIADVHKRLKTFVDMEASVISAVEDGRVGDRRVQGRQCAVDGHDQ